MTNFEQNCLAFLQENPVKEQVYQEAIASSTTVYDACWTDGPRGEQVVYIRNPLRSADLGAFGELTATNGRDKYGRVLPYPYGVWEQVLSLDTKGMT